MTDSQPVDLYLEQPCSRVGCVDAPHYVLASDAEVIARLRQIEGVEEIGWCVKHREMDAARPDTDDVRQVCMDSQFWVTGERGDCEFTEALLVPVPDSRKEK